jgi:hypothetical protein
MKPMINVVIETVTQQTLECGCLRLAKMCLCQVKRLSRCNPRNFFCLGKLLVVDVDPGTCCSTSGKGDMRGFRAIAFQSPFGKTMLNSVEGGSIDN